MSINTVSLKERIIETGLSLGFNRLVVASIAPLSAAEQASYNAFLANGYAASMDYLAREPERRFAPKRTFAQARSVLTVSVGYYNSPPPPPENCDTVYGRVAGYAVGRDYHVVMRAKLKELHTFIEKECGRKVAFRAVADDAAYFEQAFAERHGLGFVGKNTLVILPKLGGSYNLIGELFLDLELPPDEPYRGTCGACFRCGAACPTGAIKEVSLSPVDSYQSSAVQSSAPAIAAAFNAASGGAVGAKSFLVDARSCLSFLTIENKGGIELSFRDKLGSWVFGCDICQDVCPYNSRLVGGRLQSAWPEFRPEAGVGHYLDLFSLFDFKDQAEFHQRFLSSPVRRPKLRGMRRNALVVMGNQLAQGSAEPALVVSKLRPFLEAETDEMLIEHGLWMLSRSAAAASSCKHLVDLKDRLYRRLSPEGKRLADSYL
ncbi:MAG: DUF1730 domain-containing protein [Candidatus Obscuribacterales bacterium]|nr:DUF1730 domain-containing protein [Candidatus Obscuribacterales bacterium]